MKTKLVIKLPPGGAELTWTDCEGVTVCRDVEPDVDIVTLVLPPGATVALETENEDA